MADFDQMGDLDLPQMQEASEDSNEKFQERLARAQKALKQLKKDEKKHKKQDNHLARIITYFLQKKENTNLANLIAELVKKDVPSDFILALLAIVDASSKDVILVKKEQILLEGQVELSQALEIQEGDFDANVKVAINEWIEHLYLIASQEVEKLMEKTLDENLEINLNVLQLSAFLLQRFLQHKKQPAEYQKIYDFVELALKHLYEKLQVEFVEKMQIAEKSLKN